MPQFDDALDLAQVATTATPGAGRTKIFVGTDGLPYFLTPTGVVVPFSYGDVAGALHNNANFETVSGATPTVWDTGLGPGGSFTTETTDIFLGSRSATVATSAGTNFQILLSDTFTVAGGDTLSVAAWAHKITGSPVLKIGILTATSGTPGFFDGVSARQESEFQTLATTFTKYAKDFVVPAGHTAARLFLWFGPTATEATSSRVDFTTSSRAGASTPVLPGNSWVKEACRAATTGSNSNVATAAQATADGVSLAVGDRVLRLFDGASNGIYLVTVVGTGTNGTWVRASDAGTAAQLAGAEVAVTSGTVNGGTRWGTSFKATDTLGTTDMVWSKASAVGSIQLWAGGTVLPGHLECDGGAVSRTTYATLFAIIGTQFGVGNGSTTFNLPDLRDRVPIGASGTKAVGSTGGAATHTHALSDAGQAQMVVGTGIAAARLVAGMAGYTESNRMTGGIGTPVAGQTAGSPLRGATDPGSTLPPYQALRYMIRYQ